MVIDYSSFKELHMKQSKFINQLLKHCLRRFSKYSFFIGVSTVLENIEQITDFI